MNPFCCCCPSKKPSTADTKRDHRLLLRQNINSLDSSPMFLGPFHLFLRLKNSQKNSIVPSTHCGVPKWTLMRIQHVLWNIVRTRPFFAIATNVPTIAPIGTLDKRCIIEGISCWDHSTPIDNSLLPFVFATTKRVAALAMLATWFISPPTPRQDKLSLESWNWRKV
jgi:hypothetical protein